MFGLLKHDIDYIIKALQSFNEIENAKIFGSRALGNYKKGSDVDIAIYGNDVSRKTLYRLNDLLNEEYPLPYFFDILNYSDINNEKLKEHIEVEGIEIYKKNR